MGVAGVLIYYLQQDLLLAAGYSSLPKVDRGNWTNSPQKVPVEFKLFPKRCHDDENCPDPSHRHGGRGHLKK